MSKGNVKNLVGRRVYIFYYLGKLRKSNKLAINSKEKMIIIYSNVKLKNLEENICTFLNNHQNPVKTLFFEIFFRLKRACLNRRLRTATLHF